MSLAGIYLHRPGGKPFEVGLSSGFFVYVISLASCGAPPHLLPDPVVVEMAAHHWGARSLHAATDLGYKPRDPSETLRDTIDWPSDVFIR